MLDLEVKENPAPVDGPAARRAQLAAELDQAAASATTSDAGPVVTLARAKGITEEAARAMIRGDTARKHRADSRGIACIGLDACHYPRCVSEVDGEDACLGKVANAQGWPPTMAAPDVAVDDLGTGDETFGELVAVRKQLELTKAAEATAWAQSDAHALALSNVIDERDALTRKLEQVKAVANAEMEAWQAEKAELIANADRQLAAERFKLIAELRGELLGMTELRQKLERLERTVADAEDHDRNDDAQISAMQVEHFEVTAVLLQVAELLGFEGTDGAEGYAYLRGWVAGRLT